MLGMDYVITRPTAKRSLCEAFRHYTVPTRFLARRIPSVTVMSSATSSGEAQRSLLRVV